MYSVSAESSANKPQFDLDLFPSNHSTAFERVQKYSCCHDKGWTDKEEEDEKAEKHLQRGVRDLSVKTAGDRWLPPTDSAQKWK